MPDKRKRHLREAAHLPWQVLGDRADPCQYCGVPSEALDHVPPVSHVGLASSAGRVPPIPGPLGQSPIRGVSAFRLAQISSSSPMLSAIASVSLASAR